MTGKVWLVGAGPGDPGLMTRKAIEVLAAAEVVVYDSLVSDGILAMIPPTAKRIDAGKRAGNHKLRQEQTNRVLLDEAACGHRVVRLKGGDPFLFGRGGEELELLQEHQIPYEVVPGISSAMAVPAYNGIPVTHRDFASSVHIITGQKRHGPDADLDYEALVRVGGTLVFLMGVSALNDICAGLLHAGMDGSTPAAILQEGTTAAQRRVVATVETLPQRAEQAHIGTPAIIVVGGVCALAESFGWWERLPLSGCKILLTRPRELNSVMAGKLRTLGAEVVELPAIATVPIENNSSLQAALEKLESYQWIAFTSPSGVRIFLDAMAQAQVDVRRLCRARIAALGEGTAKALRQRGILADLVPEQYDGASLGRAIAQRAQAEDRILLPRAAMGNSEILEALQAFSVDDIATYDTVSCPPAAVDVAANVEQGKIFCAVFTSSSSVRAFAAAYPQVDFSSLPAACIGRQTMDTAMALGMPCRMAQKATMESLLELIISMKESERM